MELKSPKRYYIFKLILFVILDVFIFLLRAQILEYLKIFIGTLMLLYSVEEIAFELVYDRKNFFHKEKPYLGFVELLIGISVLITDIPFSTVCVVWATWAILREAYEIKDIIVELKNHLPRIISGVESFIAIGLSIQLIIAPSEIGAMIHIYLLLAELICAPLVPLLDIVLPDKKKAK